MPDGHRDDPGDDGAEQAALADEARLIRRVRWRLVAWSGVSTLIVLVVLGIALYAAVANTLATASIDQLANRVDPWVAALEGTVDTARPAAGVRLPARSRQHLPVRIRCRREHPCAWAGSRSPSSAACPTTAPSQAASEAPDGTGRAHGIARDRNVARDADPRPAADPASRVLAGRPDLLPPGRAGPLDGGRDAERPAVGPARRRRPGRRRRVRARDRLRPPRPRPDPRVARGPADGAPPPARVRRGREPRAADAADRHPARPSSTSSATGTSRSATRRPRRSTTSTPRSPT